MSAAPRVSVILATYHWPSVLRYAVETVLAQTMTDFELLVVGDHCTDGTEALVRSVGDGRVHWHNLPENTGNQAGPNNAGLKLARAPLIAYMHQDDLWLPNHLDVLVRALQEHDAPAAHTLCLQISPVAADSAERVRVVMGLPNSGGSRYGPEGRAVYTPALMHRTEAARAIGGWRDWRKIYRTPVLDFVHRLAGPNWRIVPVSEVTVIKFNSAERRNSYIEQPCHEQAAYRERMRCEPDWLARELVLALEAMMTRTRGIRLLDQRPDRHEKGSEIRHYRQMRGLEA